MAGFVLTFGPGTAYDSANYRAFTDRYGIRNRHEIGVTQMMWSSDFPHGGSDWPNSTAIIEEHFADVPADERDLIVFANAARLHGVDVDTLAPSPA